MKQTAVDWLCNEWLYIDQEFDMKLIDKKIYWERLKSVQEQAKQMEKEQMEKIFKQTKECAIKCDGVYFKYESFEKYYNETFKSE